MTKDKTSSKQSHSALVRWFKSKENMTQAEVLQYLQQNKDKLEKSLASIDKRDLLYRFTQRCLGLFSLLAGMVDKVKNLLMHWLMKIPAPEFIKQSLHTTRVMTNFKAMIDFIRTKLYSFKRAPYNTSEAQQMDEVIGHANKQGLDVKQHFPEIVDKFVQRKNQMLQHSYFKEFTKSFSERLLAIPFSFNRSLSPVLADRALWHKFFAFLEHRYIKDLILVNDNGQQTSFKTASKRDIESSEVVRTLYETSVLKAHGHRVFIIGHHEGYLGPYFVRSALRQLGFENLAANCNTVAGPRVFSSLFLKSGATNVGNLFLTLPSQRTTAVNEQGLAKALQKSARRTQFLIKMPDSGLKLIERLNYEEFMQSIIHLNEHRFTLLADALTQPEKQEFLDYLSASDACNTMADLHKADYDLFKSVMHEPFLIFPEGSRSYNDENGDITLKYFNPKYLQVYLRPGDVILPISLVGGSDIVKGVKLVQGKLGLSLGKPFEVNAGMIENFEVEGVEIMRNIANLSNIKKVTLDDRVQAGDTSGLDI